MANLRALQLLNAGAFVVTLAMNALVNVLPLNGVTTGVVSDSWPNLFTPPGYVFAIWAVIYTLALVFSAYQARASQGGEPYLGRIGYLYAASGAVNVTWLAVFHFSYRNPPLYFASLAVLLALLGILLLIYRRLGIGLAPVPLGEKLGVHAHFSVYLGWISLASIAGIASGINILAPGIPTDTQALATVAMLAVALTLTALMLYLRRDILFAAVVIWATVGIALKQQAIPVIYYSALGVALLVVLATAAVPLIKKKGLSEYYLE